MKSAILGCALGGVLGFIFSWLIEIIFGGFSLLSISIILSLSTATIMGAISGAVLITSMVLAANFGMKISGGYKVLIDSEKGKITLRKIEVIPAALISSFVFIPISILYLTLVILPFMSMPKMEHISPITSITLIAILILGGIIIFIFSAISIFIHNFALSVSSGLPLRLERTQNGILFKGVSTNSLVICYGIEMLIYGVIIAIILGVVLFVLIDVIDHKESTAIDNIGTIAIFNGLINIPHIIMQHNSGFGILEVIYVSILVGFLFWIVILFLSMPAFIIISSMLICFIFNIICNITKGYNIYASADKIHLIFNGADPIKTGIILMIYCLIIYLFNMPFILFMTSMVALLFFNNVNDFLFSHMLHLIGIVHPILPLVLIILVLITLIGIFIIGISAIIGLISAFVINSVIKALKGYEIEGSNLNLLFGAD